MVPFRGTPFCTAYTASKKKRARRKEERFELSNLTTDKKTIQRWKQTTKPPCTDPKNMCRVGTYYNFTTTKLIDTKVSLRQNSFSFFAQQT